MLEEPLSLNQLPNFYNNEVGLAVLGYPIKHSISPELHAAALKELSEKEPIFRKWKYQKIEVLPNRLAEALPLLSDSGYRGLNLTIPHKVEVLPLLDCIDDQAKVMGAVNTLSWENQGWKGYNTDGARSFGRYIQCFWKEVERF